MTDETELQQQAGEVDRVVYETLETFRALEASDTAVLAGASAAISRYAANTILRSGGEPTIRSILGGLMKLINFSAEQIILTGPKAPQTPAEGGPNG